MAAQELRGLAFDAGARSLKSVAMKVSKARRRSRSVGGWLYREGIWAAASVGANRERAERRVTFFLKMPLCNSPLLQIYEVVFQLQSGDL
jgi:hypothetical protein